MRRDTVLFRVTALAAFSGLYAVSLPSVAWSQTAGILPDSAEAQAEVNPPALVGALIAMQGTVSFHAPGSDQWEAAVLNYPVTDGEGLWTEPDAQARISIGDAALTMAGGSDFELDTLDGTGMVATLSQGEVYLHVRSLFPGQTLTLVTPRGAATIASPGRYDIAAGTTDSVTLISAVEGAVTLGEGAGGEVPAGQSAMISGAQAPFQVQIGPLQQTAFLAAMMARRAPPAVANVPPLVADMPGGDELQEYGTWSDVPSYGQVWYPQVAAGWVPYREGHWAYVAPWGWTWVDDDPWGFAPFHYGRWASIGGRWGWLPGANVVEPGALPYPVYAPALVTFFGVGAAVGVTAALLSSGQIGWVPLGPREVYHPWFHAAPAYIREVNIRHVTNITEINRTSRITVNEFRNAHGATVVPAAAMATSQPIRGVGRAADPRMLREARPVVGRQPLRPTTATLGVTPAVARAVHAVPPPAGVHVAQRPAAPGPAIRPSVRRASTAPGAPAGAPGRPERPQFTPGAARPGAPQVRPTPAVPHPAARPAAGQEVRVAPHPPAATVARPAAPHPTPPAAPHPAPALHPHEAVRPAVRPAPPPHVATPTVGPAPRPEVHAAPHPAVPAAPRPVQHVAPPPRPEVHAAPPPRPVVRAAPPPRPVVRAAPPPRPEVRAAPPPRPEVRAAPPPRPQAHAVPPAGHPEQRGKKPGER